MTGDVVTCMGNYMVAYQAMKQAGLAQAARYGLLLRKTHLLPVGESNYPTQGQVSGVDCQTFETEESRRRRVWHAVGEGLAASSANNTSSTSAHCTNNYFGGSDCTATTQGPNPYVPTPPPAMRTDTVCSGGTVIPGTEGHVLQLSIAFLTIEEATAAPRALSAYRLLGYPDVPPPAAAPSASAPVPNARGNAAPGSEKGDEIAPFTDAPAPAAK